MRFPSLRSLAVPLVAVLALGACGDSTAPTPRLRAPSAPTAMLNDGSKAGGNPDFFFLPSVVANPSSDPDFSPGQFAAGWRPVVNACEVDATNLGGGCITGTVRSYSGSAVAVSLTDEHYAVQVDTKESWAIAGKTYRFTVTVVGSQPLTLGFVDIALLSGSAKNAGTGDLVSLQDGRTIPLKFRIEKGATVRPGVDVFSETVVTDAAGATILTGGTGGPGTFALQLPADFLPEGLDQVVITVEKLSTGPGGGCVTSVPDLEQTSDCWSVNSYPEIPRVTQDLTVAFCPSIPTTDPRYDAQAIFKFDAPATLQELATVTTTLVDCDGTGQIGAAPRQPGMLGAIQYGLASVGRGLSKAFGPNTAYAIDLGWGGRIESTEETLESGVFSEFFWGVPMRVDVLSGDGQTGYTGRPLAQPLRVRVTGTHLHDGAAVPIPGVAVNAGAVTNGTLSPSTATTDASGIASFSFTPAQGGASSATVEINMRGTAVAATFNASALAPISTGPAVSCSGAAYTSSSGDLLDRGFHVLTYPGDALSGVQVRIIGSPGTQHSVTMSAFAVAYDSTELGTSTQAFTIGTSGSSYVTFSWPTAAVTPGTPVAFRMSPAPAGLFYAVAGSFSPGDPSCSIVETEGTTAPLDTFRRQGVEATIFATFPVIP